MVWLGLKHFFKCRHSELFSCSKRLIEGIRPYLAVTSVVEPKQDFFAGAGADEKAPAPGCCCVTKGLCGGNDATILTFLVKF